MTNSNYGDQTPKKTEIKCCVVKNTTSPEEKNNGSMNFVLVCKVSEILKFDLEKNLRISYSDATNKNRNATHKAIYDSFDYDPDRFIQRHSGFTAVCDNLKQTSKEEYGINTVVLENASLINGGQSQGEIRKWFEHNADAIKDKWDNTNIRIEVIVEKDEHEVHEICVARNDSTNVSDLSKLGNSKYFDDLNDAMVSELGSDFELQLSETDDKLPTQTMLQVLRAITPKSLKGDSWSKDMVAAYSGKRRCLINYKDRFDAEKESQKENSSYTDPILDFYRSFAPQAWKLYLDWTSDKDWIQYWKRKTKTMDHQRMGKYNEKDDTFELTWAIVCPVLFGLQNFIQETPNGWIYDEPKSFDKKAYMDFVMAQFKENKYVPQDFAKEKSTYLLLRDQVSELI